MIEVILRAAQICSAITTICALAVLIIKPLRERVLGDKQVKEGQKCLLRSNMLHTYYRHREDGRIRQYEYENFLLEYQAYKALGGNSFIEDICREVRTWEVIT